MVVYGQPFFLEDITGQLTGSDFLDINDRMRLSVRCTLSAPDGSRTVYMIHDMSPDVVRASRVREPAAVLDYGQGGALGTVVIGSGSPMPMGQYLTKLSLFGSSKQRKFIAADGQQYVWRFRDGGDLWTCRDSAGTIVASYSLPTPGVQHMRSSGFTLTIEEAYPHLAAEFLASLLIMRHIHQGDQ